MRRRLCRMSALENTPLRSILAIDQLIYVHAAALVVRVYAHKAGYLHLICQSSCACAEVLVYMSTLENTTWCASQVGSCYCPYNYVLRYYHFRKFRSPRACAEDLVDMSTLEILFSDSFSLLTG